MVSGFQDDLDPEELRQSETKAATVPSMDITLTSDEEEQPPKASKGATDEGDLGLGLGLR